MLKYSFMSSYANCTKEQMLGFMKQTDKPFKFTYGLGYRHPITYKVDMTREDAIKKLLGNGLVDVTEEDDYIHVNEFSDNDMW